MVDLTRVTRPPRRGPTASLTARADEPLWRRVDWILVFAVIALCTLGALLVWSATKTAQLEEGADPQYFLKRHVLNFSIGAVLGAIVAAVDYRALRTYAPLVYLASCLGLIAVLGVGTTINGAHSWIVLPAGFQIQPSEFAKAALIVSMAMLLSERRQRDQRREAADVPLALALAAPPMALIMMQPDIGTIFVFVFTILCLLSVAGVSWRWIVGLIVAGAVVAVLSVALHVLKDYQLDRFRSFANPDDQSLEAGYNVAQAKIAIGSGGLFGNGLFDGPQTKGQFIPEAQTDFIFSVAGEEFGLVGAGGIVLLFMIVLWRSLTIAAQSKDLFGRLVAAGISGWFAFQAFVNIGMTLGIMPVTGLPLPFVSYGGSSMFANCLAVGLLLNVHMRNAVMPRVPG